jgi:glycosyltransferase involved in cell wall biosynthesis
MKKLLIITYYWPPSGGPGVQRWLKFAHYLQQSGYEPLVVTVDPLQANYPVTDESLNIEVSEKIKVFHTSTLEPYSLYKRMSGRKQAPYSGFANEPKAGFFSTISRFIRGNLFVPDARIGWNRYAIAKARELIRLHDIGILITTSPPHSTQLAGLQLKKEFPSLNWIADLRDPWTDIFYYKKMLHLPFIRKRDLELERKVLLQADQVITVSEFIRKIFQQKIKTENSSKIHVITNGFDDDDFNPITQKQVNKVFTISYIGTLADEYDLNGFLQAFEAIQTEISTPIKLHFTGSISTLWKTILLERFAKVIEIEGHTNHDNAIRQMQSADLLLLVIPRIEQNQGIVTGKIFEYMASGGQILGVGPPDGDAARILDETQTGKMFHYNDVQSLKDFMLNVFHHPNKWKPNPHAITQYSRKQLTRKLTELF